MSVSTAQIAQRILDRDTSYWTADTTRHERLSQRLGWLDATDYTRSAMGAIRELRESVRQLGLDTILLVGMGGSYLAPEVFARMGESGQGHPRLLTLDSTSPARILDLRSRIDLGRTLVIVSSKSGGTIETLSLYRYFLEEYRAAGISHPGRHFVAITDPGSALEEEASVQEFLACLINDSTIGGRYSALSLFGMVPAALAGLEIGPILDAADREREICASGGGGADLGVWLAEGWSDGRDKLALVLPPSQVSLGWWIEQLVAESLGKDGKGVLPWLSEKPSPATRTDTISVYYASGAGSPQPGDNWSRQAQVADIAALGAEFFRWEFATALAAGPMGVNPFDEPDVTAAKRNTSRLLEAGQTREAVAAVTGIGDPHVFMDSVGEGDYVSILAYVPTEQSPYRENLQNLVDRLQAAAPVPVTLCEGPRYLHSTGQLHKGGPDSGRFIVVVADSEPVLPIPGSDYDFGSLIAAQALGDYEALRQRSRPVMMVKAGSLPGLAAAI